MFINLYNQSIKVFFADSSADMEDTREELRVDGRDVPSKELLDAMQQTDCSVHLLGKTDIFEEGTDSSLAGTQYHAAKNLCSDRFKMFVWNPRGRENRSKYINVIRRDIEENIIYSDRPSPIVFVEDIRNIMTVKQSAVQETVASDIFFLYLHDARRHPKSYKTQHQHVERGRLQYIHQAAARCQQDWSCVLQLCGRLGGVICAPGVERHGRTERRDTDLRNRQQRPRQTQTTRNFQRNNGMCHRRATAHPIGHQYVFGQK